MMTTEQYQLLQYINQVSFAIHDTVLYMDTHPMDTEALGYYHQLIPLKKEATDLYVNNFGPLTAEQVKSKTSWTWGEEAWPWELEGC